MADRSLSDETRVYLEGARQRVDGLAAVEQLRARVDAVVVPELRRMERDELLAMRRTARKKVATPKKLSATPTPTATRDEPPRVREALLASYPPHTKSKMRQLKRKYGGRVPPELVRHPDHDTSIEAAQSILPHRSELQGIIYDAFVTHGAMTDEGLEALPEIVRLGLGPTTARRRRTDLVAMGDLVRVGTAFNARGRPMIVWDIKSRAIDS